MSVAWGFAVLALLPPTPEKARAFFTQSEKDMAMQRSRESFNDIHAKVQPKHILLLFKDWDTYFYSTFARCQRTCSRTNCSTVVITCCANISLASFSTFLPVILSESGWDDYQAQILTIPVYVCGAVSAVTFPLFSDRCKNRGWFILGSNSFLFVGWLILLVSTGPHLSYGASFLVAIGNYATIVLIYTWMNTNNVGFTRR
jgi:hypothetical protein